MDLARETTQLDVSRVVTAALRAAESDGIYVAYPFWETEDPAVLARFLHVLRGCFGDYFHNWPGGYELIFRTFGVIADLQAGNARGVLLACFHDRSIIDAFEAAGAVGFAKAVRKYIGTYEDADKAEIHPVRVEIVGSQVVEGIGGDFSWPEDIEQLMVKYIKDNPDFFLT